MNDSIYQDANGFVVTVNREENEGRECAIYEI
jgi:hypothetical protein